MSDPIDYIDLTVDSPIEKSSRSRNRNTENASNNSTTTKARKRNSCKRQTTRLQDSVIEIPVNNAHRDADPTEIIDLGNVSPSEQSGMCYVNDSTDENLIVLTCPICYEKLSSKNKPMSTRCGHIFCAQCLELALRNAKRCPTCQKATKLQSCTRLYFG